MRGPKGPLCLGHRETEVRKRKREPHFSGSRLERDGGQEAGRGAFLGQRSRVRVGVRVRVRVRVRVVIKPKIGRASCRERV